VTVRSWTTCWSIGSVHDGAVLDGLLLLNNFALIVVCGVIESSKSFFLFLWRHTLYLRPMFIDGPSLMNLIHDRH